jgi:hypothetical protein
MGEGRRNKQLPPVGVIAKSGTVMPDKAIA